MHDFPYSKHDVIRLIVHVLYYVLTVAVKRPAVEQALLFHLSVGVAIFLSPYRPESNLINNCSQPASSLLYFFVLPHHPLSCVLVSIPLRSDSY
jgi:hypothetical protein